MNPTKFNKLTAWPAAVSIIQSNTLIASRVTWEYGPRGFALSKMVASCMSREAVIGSQVISVLIS